MEGGKNEDLELFTLTGFSGLELLQDDPQARNFQDLQELQQFNSREDARAGYQVQTAWRWGYETDDATPV